MSPDRDRPFTGKDGPSWDEGCGRFRAMLDAVPVILWSTAPSGGCDFLNRGWIDYTGRALSDDLGSGWKASIHPEDAEGLDRVFSEAFEARRPFTRDVRIRRHDGAYRWFTNDGVPWHTENGRFLGYLGSCTDISDRKRLALEREQYFTLFSVASDLMVIADPKGCFQRVNPAVLRTLGYSEKDLLARPFLDFVHPEDRERTSEEMDRQLQRGFSLDFENRYLCKDGSTRWLSWRAVFVQEEGCTYATARDISELKRMQEALQQSEERYRSLFEQSQAPMLVLDPMDGAIVAANPAAERFYGWTRQDLLAKRIQEINPSPAGEMMARLHQVSAGQHLHIESQHRLSDGSIREVEIFSSPLSEGGRVLVYAILHDITERKRAEGALNEALAFNRQIIASAQQGILVYDREGQVVLMNPFMERMVGLSSDAAKGRRPEALLSTSQNLGSEGVQRALRGESVTNPPFEWTRQADETSGWATSTQAPLLGGHGEVVGVIETISDVTELRRMEEMRRKLQADLHQTQKLESLGSLAGGVAHDMNNVLAVVQAVTQTLKAKHSEDPQWAAALDTLDKASTRGRDLVRSLTNFARKDLREPEPLDLNALVREEAELLRRTTLQKVTLNLELEEPLPCVMGERSSLGSALMNLCVNAVDAMPSGGTLTLGTRSLPGGLVEISAQDTGMGMPQEVLARAMEPFFTTKPVGKGTGLGLALVYATATAHGGSFTLSSEPGQGTRALLRLPAVGTLPVPGPDPEETTVVQTPRLILLVDDEELVRTSVAGLLEVIGHQVATAAGGAEALDLLAGGFRPDLVILDQNMPGMTGVETLKRLRARHPTLPVLLATGFLETDTAERLQQDGHAACLPKPFGLRELRAQLQELFPANPA